MSEHTPGPWQLRYRITDPNEAVGVGDSDGWFVADCATTAKSDKEISANCCLIAAAPDLLTACEDALRDLGDLEQHWKNESESFDHPSEAQERRLCLDNLASTRRTITQVRAAIAKAKGQQP